MPSSVPDIVLRSVVDRSSPIPGMDVHWRSDVTSRYAEDPLKCGVVKWRRGQ